ncbi:hypothetical protein FJZ48_00570 [Candidatus Uhrbacteria bacterium]|nr:hypothetical protein [Candidatus Uhrbacteria bacterium]
MLDAFRWHTFNKPIQGVKVPGDPRAPKTFHGYLGKTRWWVIALKFIFWKEIALFRVDPQAAERGYRVGFRNVMGLTMILDRQVKDPLFRMRIGHESCTFFIIDHEGNELPLTFERKLIDPLDREYAKYPLH